MVESIPDWALEVVLLEKARQLLVSVHCVRLSKAVQVQWNRRMRSTAGNANPTRVLVQLNPRLIAFGQSEVERTLRHELAHLVAKERSGRKKIDPHGLEWRQACADLGIPGEERCHTLPLPRREIQPKFRYRCDGCGVEFGRVRRLKRGAACLRCCNRYAAGKYDTRFKFRLVESEIPPP